MKKIVSISLLSFFLISGLGAMIPQLFAKNEIKEISFQAEDFKTAFWSGQYASAAAMLEAKPTESSYLESEALSLMAAETYFALGDLKNAKLVLELALAKFPTSKSLTELSNKTGSSL